MKYTKRFKSPITLMVTLLLLLLLPNGIRAQETAPWPSDPTDIFAPGVEVVNVEADTPYLDNANHLVYVYDQIKARWDSYPYPDDTLEIEVMWDYGRSDHLLAARSRDLTDSDHEWLFDLKIGSFQPFPYLCKETIVGDLWAFFIDVDGRTYLCSTEDGRRSSLLPASVHFGDLPAGLRPTASPDGKWVFFYGRDKKDGRFHFYAYDVNAQQIIELGSDDARDIVTGVQWFDNNHIVITSGDMPSWGATAYYIADLSLPNSLVFFREVANDYLMGTTGNPPHYEWLGDGCKLAKFFPATNRFQEFTLDTRACTRGWALDTNNDERIYEITNYDKTGLPITVTLSRYNLVTGQQRDLFTGEIERLMNISPDGKYAVLVLDHNGIVDVKLDTNFDVYSERNIDEFPSPKLAILNLETQKIVYESDTTWEWMPDYWYYWLNPETKLLLNTAIDSGGGTLDNLVILDSDLFVKKPLSYTCSGPCPDVLVMLGGDQVAEVELPGSVVAYLPKSKQLLIREVSNAYIVYELANGATMLLFRADASPSQNYRPQIQKVVDGDRLIVMFGNIHYTVRIPQAES